MKQEKEAESGKRGVGVGKSSKKKKKKLEIVAGYDTEDQKSFLSGGAETCMAGAV